MLNHPTHDKLLALKLTGMAKAFRACFENHMGLFAKRRTMSRIMASCNSVSLVCTLRS
jgi:hypothetical protein